MKKMLLTGLALALLTAPAFAAETVINQADSKFVPDHVTIKAGDTLRFKNSDQFVHNITVANPEGEKTDLGMEKPGQDSVSYKFRDPGEYKVRCTIHPMMKLDVTVQ